MLPELEAVAASLADDTTVVLGDLDVSVNTIPEPFEVRTVPTLYFKTPTGFPFVYRGLRTTDAMLGFLKTKGHGRVFVSLPV